MENNGKLAKPRNCQLRYITFEGTVYIVAENVLEKIRNFAKIKTQNGETFPKLNIDIYSKFGQYYRYDITCLISSISYSF